MTPTAIADTIGTSWAKFLTTKSRPSLPHPTVYASASAFPAAVRHVDHAAVAESLGYERVWFYDSPALYEDVWMVMALAAERTSRIGIGPAVLVPDLRHVLVTASALSRAYLARFLPGRLRAFAPCSPPGAAKRCR